MKVIQEDVSFLIVEPSSRITADRILPNQKSRTLHVPTKKNYPAIDAWIPNIGAFQITVAKKHELNDSVIQDIANLGQGRNKLYWLVPPQNYKDFKCPKDLENIDQYAVMIPFDEIR